MQVAAPTWLGPPAGPSGALLASERLWPATQPLLIPAGPSSATSGRRSPGPGGQLSTTGATRRRHRRRRRRAHVAPEVEQLEAHPVAAARLAAQYLAAAVAASSGQLGAVGPPPPPPPPGALKNKKPVRVAISQQSVNGLLSLLLLFMVSVCGCIGCILKISALTVVDSLQSRGNSYLVSLALGQLLVSLFVIPSSALRIMAGDSGGLDPLAICHYQWLTLELSLVVGQLSFVLIAADNYLGLRCSKRVTTSLSELASSGGPGGWGLVRPAAAAAPSSRVPPQQAAGNQPGPTNAAHANPLEHVWASAVSRPSPPPGPSCISHDICCGRARVLALILSSWCIALVLAAHRHANAAYGPDFCGAPQAPPPPPSSQGGLHEARASPNSSRSAGGSALLPVKRQVSDGTHYQHSSSRSVAIDEHKLRAPRHKLVEQLSIEARSCHRNKQAQRLWPAVSCQEPTKAPDYNNNNTYRNSVGGNNNNNDNSGRPGLGPSAGQPEEAADNKLAAPVVGAGRPPAGLGRKGRPMNNDHRRDARMQTGPPVGSVAGGRAWEPASSLRHPHHLELASTGPAVGPGEATNRSQAADQLGGSGPGGSGSVSGRAGLQWPLLLAVMLAPCVASSVLFGRAYLRMKQFKARTYEPLGPQLGLQTASAALAALAASSAASVRAAAPLEAPSEPAGAPGARQAWPARLAVEEALSEPVARQPTAPSSSPGGSPMWPNASWAPVALPPAPTSDVFGPDEECAPGLVARRSTHAGLPEPGPDELLRGPARALGGRRRDQQHAHSFHHGSRRPASAQQCRQPLLSAPPTVARQGWLVPGSSEPSSVDQLGRRQQQSLARGSPDQLPGAASGAYVRRARPTRCQLPSQADAWPPAPPPPPPLQTAQTAQTGSQPTKAAPDRPVVLCTYSSLTDEQLLRSNIAVFALNLALWLPFVTLLLLGQRRDQGGRLAALELREAAWWLSVLSCCSSPYVYALTNKDFREAFNKLFYYCCCKSHVTFQRRAAILRRQLEVDSDGRLRLHIMPALNVCSSKQHQLQLDQQSRVAHQGPGHAHHHHHHHAYGHSHGHSHSHSHSHQLHQRASLASLGLFRAGLARGGQQERPPGPGQAWWPPPPPPPPG